MLIDGSGSCSKFMMNNSFMIKKQLTLFFDGAELAELSSTWVMIDASISMTTV